VHERAADAHGGEQQHGERQRPEDEHGTEHEVVREPVAGQVHTNGTEMTTQGTAIEATPAIVVCGTNGTASWTQKATATLTAYASENRHICDLTLSSVNDCGRRCTISAPTVMPNSATEMATNAKWYHIATLKIRVSTISYISVVDVTTNRPA
jgi:hypothetical protein